MPLGAILIMFVLWQCEFYLHHGHARPPPGPPSPPRAGAGMQHIGLITADYGHKICKSGSTDTVHRVICSHNPRCNRVKQLGIKAQNEGPIIVTAKVGETQNTADKMTLRIIGICRYPTGMTRRSKGCAALHKVGGKQYVILQPIIDTRKTNLGARPTIKRRGTISRYLRPIDDGAASSRRGGTDARPAAPAAVAESPCDDEVSGLTANASGCPELRKKREL